MRQLVVFIVASAIALANSCGQAAEPASFEAGFAKVDITPEVPLRLSGYAVRTVPFDHVQTPIATRAMAFRADGGPVFVLMTIDSIGTPASLTTPVAKKIEKRYGVTRDRVVFCSSHSHSTPHLAGGLTNLFSVPLTDAQWKATEHYTEQLSEAMVKVAGEAIKDLAPAKLSVGQGKVGFAMNRRGPNRPPASSPPPVPPRGAVDHSVPVLKITDDNGNLRGVVFNYACHATTLTGSENVVDGDWPGYACRYLEGKHEGIVALCTIGCGGDANPAPRAGEHPEQHAQAHGRAMALEVGRLLKQQLDPITAKPQASYGFAALPIDRPTVADLKADLKSSSPQVVRRAEYYLDLLTRMDRIPESYPMPIQTWKFGDEFTMVFLGGEVVVDYALRLKKELKSDLAWISAYSNDVFGYVASERIRPEGGYEVIGSMIYYNLPGPWKSGTENIIIARVHELLKNPEGEGALSPEKAKQSMIVPPGFDLKLVACEPLIEDPVNFAFGPDGRLWVAEMRDYPRGIDGEGSPGGRIKVLSDTNQDGIFDEAQTFLDGLSYPNGVIPWRDGALVSCAPDIFFAKDTDGDGKADQRKILFTGFPEANPQHRVNGFTWGLNGLMYANHGANGITCPPTGKTYNLAGRDFAFDPDTLEVVTMSGGSQFGRCRDSWGNWFANTNTHPIFHYVAEDHWLSRNPNFSPPNTRRMIVPSAQYQVWPESRIVGRFNDLNTAGRFTAACSPTIFLAPGFGEHLVAFVCAPVHNLVRGFELIPDGISYRVEMLAVDRVSQGSQSRGTEKEPQEFLASTDPWFRPVRAATGPDGALWVADMYRLVIEHPEWIPEAWQTRLDVRAGTNKGRIWRLSRTDHKVGALPDLTKLSTSELVAKLEDPNGVIRDLAQQLLVWRGDTSVIKEIRQLVTSAKRPTGSAQALGALVSLNALDAETVRKAFNNDDPRVVRLAIRFAAPLLNDHPNLGEEIVALAKSDNPRIRLQAAFTLGAWDDERAATALADLATGPDASGWIKVAVKSSAVDHADQILSDLLRRNQTKLAPAMVGTILGANPSEGPQKVLDILETESDGTPLWRMKAILEVARRAPEAQGTAIAAHSAVQEALAAARKCLDQEEVPLPRRIVAVQLLGGSLSSAEARKQLAESLNPRMPIEVQEEIVASLAATGDTTVAPQLLAGWDHHGPRVRRVILQAMLSRIPWTKALLQAIEKGTIEGNDLDAASRQRLLTSDNKTIQARSKQLLEATSHSSRAALVAKYEPVLKMTGDPARGRAVFKKTCAQCHKLEGMGKEFGPDLAALTDKTPLTVLTAVLDPNKAVDAKFRAYTVVTNGGQVLSGLIIRETTAAITLASADGRTTELLRSEIAILKDSGKSFMPEGLERELSKQELADVLSFVRQAGP